MISRRAAIRTVFAAGAALAIPTWLGRAVEPVSAASRVPRPEFCKPLELPHDYNAFEPHIDAERMRIYHDRHHAAYVAKLNLATSSSRANANMSPLVNAIDWLPA